MNILRLPVGDFFEVSDYSTYNAGTGIHVILCFDAKKNAGPADGVIVPKIILYLPVMPDLRILPRTKLRGASSNRTI